MAQVRKCTGWRFLTAQDKIELEQWLRQGAAYEGQSAEMLLDAACGRLRRYASSHSPMLTMPPGVIVNLCLSEFA